MNRSICTVKADAAQASFDALGRGIVWAVIDSGVDHSHLHFTRHDNLLLNKPLEHIDFTGGKSEKTDEFGHGTHVAGIIAGEYCCQKGEACITVCSRERNEDGEVKNDWEEVSRMRGMAPECKIVSYKALDANGRGKTSSLMSAIQQIQEINGHGRRLLIHGVNLSVGYDFEPEWFACGQSPLCVEVNRLVKSGVVVVVAAGNTGYGRFNTVQGVYPAGIGLTINDPGNADEAITVGSTHKDMPHTYGVSYFSSKGPTGDGRLKPDLLAPGEKILSCGASVKAQKALAEPGAPSGADMRCVYVEDSGTSMAAPHVSGCIAAFLSIRREFIGQPEKIKQIFTSAATDLRRERTFQGAGLIDLMRAIQSV